MKVDHKLNAALDNISNTSKELSLRRFVQIYGIRWWTCLVVDCQFVLFPTHGKLFLLLIYFILFIGLLFYFSCHVI